MCNVNLSNICNSWDITNTLTTTFLKSTGNNRPAALEGLMDWRKQRSRFYLLQCWLILDGQSPLKNTARHISGCSQHYIYHLRGHSAQWVPHGVLGGVNGLAPSSANFKFAWRHEERRLLFFKGACFFQYVWQCDCSRDNCSVLFSPSSHPFFFTLMFVCHLYW